MGSSSIVGFRPGSLTGRYIMGVLVGTESMSAEGKTHSNGLSTSCVLVGITSTPANDRCMVTD